jgi:hypothetical protein
VAAAKINSRPNIVRLYQLQQQQQQHYWMHSKQQQCQIHRLGYLCSLLRQ